MYPSIILEFNIATNTQIGRIDLFNKWKVRHKKTDRIMYIKDAGNAHDFEWADIKEGTKIVKIRKHVGLYEDELFTKPIADDIEYVAEDYETLEYEKIYDNENAFQFDKYSRGGEFIENMVSDNSIEFCKRWLHLAGFNEILTDIDEYYQINSIGPYKNNWNSTILPTTQNVIDPIINHIAPMPIKPFKLIDRMKEIGNYERPDPRSWIDSRRYN